MYVSVKKMKEMKINGHKDYKYICDATWIIQLVNIYYLLILVKIFLRIVMLIRTLNLHIFSQNFSYTLNSDIF